MASVQQARAEVAGSPLFASLQSALARGSPHYNTAASPPSASGLPPCMVHAASADGDSEGPGTQAWASAAALVVYGLGSLQHSKVPRYQAALALLLKELLPGISNRGLKDASKRAGKRHEHMLGPGPAPSPLSRGACACADAPADACAAMCSGLTEPPQAYDPAFTSLDQQLLARLGFQLTGDSQGQRLPVAKPTFFYLPHCEGHLCDALLAANCGSAAQLASVAILGNRFSTYHQLWAPRRQAPPGQVRPDKLLQLCASGALQPPGIAHVWARFKLHMQPSCAADAAVACRCGAGAGGG